jgi:hypothetical protein
MAEAQLVGTSTGKSSGSNFVILTMPGEIQNGDLMVVTTLSGSASAYSNDWEAKGWWKHHSQAINSRQFAVYSRIYNSATPASDYNITLNASAFTRYVVLAFRNHGVVASSDIVLGSIWTRAGVSQALVTAPSMDTPGVDYLALAITGEATSAATTMSRTAGDFTLVVDASEDAQAIEWIAVYSKVMPTPGSTGIHSLTYSGSSLNGIGMQLAIPPGTVATPIDTGRIGMHAAINPSSDSITVGVDKLGGTVIQAALMSPDGTVEIDRVTLSNDVTTGWGNVRFSSLESNSYYRVWFYADGVLQTDASLIVRTLPVGTASYVFVAGSCQFTGSNHPIFDRIREEAPLFVSHMGDLHYADATTEAAWRAGHESSFAAPRFKALFETTMLSWAPDNHDRIITNPTGAGTGLNLGETDPQTALGWKQFAGSTGWASPDTLGRTWVAGRVRYIQTDAWSVRDDGDGDPAPRTFLGPAQKQWFKDTLDAAQEPLIIWFAQWTATNNANGRWNSFPEETSELEAFINARPDLKRRMILVGGDSHSLQADDGSRGGTSRFKGIPSLNISGFNRSSDSGDGQTFWAIANAPLRAVGQTETEIGGYSRITISDDGMHIRFLWEGIRVNAAGVSDRVAFYTRSYGSPYDRVYYSDLPVSSLNIGDKMVWQEPYYGATI